MANSIFHPTYINKWIPCHSGDRLEADESYLLKGIKVYFCLKHLNKMKTEKLTDKAVITLKFGHCSAWASLKSDQWLRTNTNYLLKKENRNSYPRLSNKIMIKTFFRFSLVSEQNFLKKKIIAASGIKIMTWKRTITELSTNRGVNYVKPYWNKNE